MYQRQHVGHPPVWPGCSKSWSFASRRVVTGGLLAEVIAVAGSPLTTTAAAERLMREGWLSPLRTRDAWEFVPASRAGRYPGNAGRFSTDLDFAAPDVDTGELVLGTTLGRPDVRTSPPGSRSPRARSGFRAKH